MYFRRELYRFPTLTPECEKRHYLKSQYMYLYKCIVETARCTSRQMQCILKKPVGNKRECTFVCVCLCVCVCARAWERESAWVCVCKKETCFPSTWAFLNWPSTSLSSGTPPSAKKRLRTPLREKRKIIIFFFFLVVFINTFLNHFFFLFWVFCTYTGTCVCVIFQRQTDTAKYIIHLPFRSVLCIYVLIDACMCVWMFVCE